MYIENIVLVGIIVIAWFAAKAHYKDKERSLVLFEIKHSLRYTLSELDQMEERLNALYKKNTGTYPGIKIRQLAKDPVGQQLIELFANRKLLQQMNKAGWIKAPPVEPKSDYHPKISPKRELERQFRDSSSETISEPLQAKLGYWGRDAEWCIYLKKLRHGEVN
jgi:hypothetical protein